MPGFKKTKQKIFIFNIIVFFSNIYANPVDAIVELQNRIIKISEETTKSVVHIKVVTKKKERKYESFGSGFIIDKNGYLLTNHHVVENATQIRLKFYNDPNEYEVEVLGSDETTDVALLKIKEFKDMSSKIHPIKIGVSNNVKVGQWVLAAGNPFGFDQTISFGIVSAKGRNLPDAPVLNEFIQTDAMIAPGSSGGPLLNLEGEVIGINSRANSMGIGFTIPIEVALNVKRKILEEGQIKRSWLGLSFKHIEIPLRKTLKLSSKEGALVSYVIKNSDAHKKIYPLDIITSIDGKEITAVEEKDIPTIDMKISDLPIDKNVQIHLLRYSGKSKTYKEYVYSIKVLEKPPSEGDLFESDLGFIARNITEKIYNHYLLQKREGIYIEYVEQGSEAGQSKLYMGDIILSINKKPIKSVSDLKKIFSEKNVRKYIFTILRGREIFLLLLENKNDNS
ncbi:MAG: trypsin-like peptidase domain-containing protein [Spirochaetia bacterium]|nr:trypsin-like peptidase domain-containing protein [Spirochaetia bacterium]